MLKGVPSALVPCSYRLAPCLVVESISSSTAATPGEVVKETVAAGGATAAGGAWLPAMALASLVTTAVSATIFCANSGFDGALPVMFARGMHDCLALGRMVGTYFHWT